MQAVLDYFNLDVSNPVTGASHPLSALSRHGQHGRADLSSRCVLREVSQRAHAQDLLPRCDAVMTQEMCKDFLAGSSNRDAAARQRYKLYQKATGLEQAEEGLIRARNNVGESSERLQVRPSRAWCG